MLEPAAVETEEIKACPFCGATGCEPHRFMQTAASSNAYVLYPKCGSHGPVGRSKSASVVLWNERITTDAECAAAYDAAEAVPLSRERIDEIVQFVTSQDVGNEREALRSRAADD